MVEVPDAVVTELVRPVAAALPLIIARTPAAPAAELGRLRAVADGDTWPVHESAFGSRALAGAPARVRPASGLPPVRDALDSLPPLLVERLLGALELTVPELDLSSVPDLGGLLAKPSTGHFLYASMSGQSEAVTGVAVLEQSRPGVLPLVVALAHRLAAQPAIAARLTVGPGIVDERDIAAAHGAAHLALAVATTATVVHQVGIAPLVTKPPAVLGAAIGTAVLLLREAPMPAGYDAALLARARAEYLMPRQTHTSTPVAGHRFALLEGTSVPEVDFAGNGLVTVVPGGAVIRTGVEAGHVQVTLSILDGPPPAVATDWDEVVEVSWRAAVGGASLIGPHPGDLPKLHRVTPPWPGDYRLRVHARGRDDTDLRGRESYQLLVWRAPAAPDTVYARADRLGYRLRGEAEPGRTERPETAYRWLSNSNLDVAATVTVVTGSSVGDVLRAFGADPARPESMRDINDELMRRQSIDPWVAVLDVGDAVIAVEYNGWEGSRAPVLTRSSAGGRAASMFWNVNAVTRLSFAEHGDLLLSVEPFDAVDAPRPVAPAVADLDFADHRRDKRQMGLVAVQRFTGHTVSADDVARIEAADVGFRIVPNLPALRPRRPRPGDPLGTVVDALAEIPEPQLRDLAWWVAAQAAQHGGLGEDPDVVASLTARALTEQARQRAGRSQGARSAHRWVWLALHGATNPDPVAAVADAVDAARYAAGPHAANLVADARARIVGFVPR
ncbi:DUF6461 domain-containing protein [Polymorphospora rubra]|uniref:Uncharacterized protein n=1 Tax=Polymorphospora rubra TaxID=338584 RepID=A0A810N4L2_9ACTN|nr:DUF6461 domain-containing protein [Polymorphospora rubra]BCJ68326.1 hypothetical protein Prubr_53470 [Polymorphospora rubra]